jgi:uncharacterized Zn-binding protein involved in type VI secretion
MPGVAYKGSVCDGACGFPPAPSANWSNNVFVNNKNVVRQGDRFEEHGDGVRVVASGSSTVFANGKQLARIGDPISCGASISTGSSNVISG